MRGLCVTSPMMRGEDVVRLQRLLESWGYAPGPADGKYGPTTAAALAELQSRVDPGAELASPGAYTEALAARLSGVPPSLVLRRDASVVGQRALAEALRHVGVKESPPGSNRTKFGEWYGADGVKWCAIFVSYCFAVGADYVLCDGSRGAGVRKGRGCSYVPTLAAWLRASGHWVGRTVPRPGDIAIFNWDDRGNPEHVGLVEVYRGGPHSEFSSVEGNTSVNSDSDGGEVQRRPRYLHQVDGFGRIA